MKRALVADVFLDFAFDWNDVCQNIAMRDEDPFGFGGGAGGEQDLGELILFDGDWRRGGNSGGFAQAGEFPDSRIVGERDFVASQDSAGFHDVIDASDEFGRGAVVDGHGDDALEQTAPQRYDPFRPVLGVEDHLFVFRDSGGAEAGGKRSSQAGDFIVTEVPAAETVVVNEKFVGEVREVLEEIEQRVAGHPAHSSSAR